MPVVLIWGILYLAGPASADHSNSLEDSRVGQGAERFAARLTTLDKVHRVHDADVVIRETVDSESSVLGMWR